MPWPQVLSTTGLVGLMLPASMPELLFMCVIITLSLTLYSYALGQIADAVEAQDDALVAARDKTLQARGRPRATGRGVYCKVAPA